jgi:RNA-directed DNA polymerase
LARVRAKVTDSKVLELVQAYLTAKVMETVKGWTPEEGTPQGAVISPLLSNLYPIRLTIAWPRPNSRW